MTSRAWVAAYGAVAVVLSCLPILGVLAGAAIPVLLVSEPTSYADVLGLLVWLPVSVATGMLSLAVLVWAVVRLAALGVHTGVHPVRSGAALAVWTTVRVLDDARTWLFPLYASSLTPAWLRLLGAKIGKDVEASTV